MTWSKPFEPDGAKTLEGSKNVRKRMKGPSTAAWQRIFYFLQGKDIMDLEEIRNEVKKAVEKARETCPLVPSITNTVTINLVANAQLASGGSAAMVYLPDEGEGIGAICQAFYINMGTLLPVYAETLPRTARALQAHHKPWVLDPVGIGLGGLRTVLLKEFRETTPTIVRGNASEIIGLANLWGLDAGIKKEGGRGVDSVDTVDSAIPAAKSLASFIHGAVAVSGENDIVTDGNRVIRSFGGSILFTKVTGSGCSLGGVTAVYAAVSEPLIGALTAVNMYNAAGKRAAEKAKGPGTFEKYFLDEMYTISAEDVAGNPMEMVEE